MFARQPKEGRFVAQTSLLRKLAQAVVSGPPGKLLPDRARADDLPHDEVDRTEAPFPLGRVGRGVAPASGIVRGGKVVVQGAAVENDHLAMVGTFGVAGVLSRRP